jgi:uncharacterized membrane protein
MDILLAALHVFGWAVYAGGALTMELVLRHAQGAMRPSQVAVVCMNAGLRYRWWSLFALLLLGATGFLMALRLDEAALAARGTVSAFHLGASYGRTMLALVILWALLLGVLALLALWVHPTMHTRFSSAMDEAQVEREKERIRSAIRRMDLLLRLELGGALLALLLGSSLRLGGLL